MKHIFKSCCLLFTLLSLSACDKNFEIAESETYASKVSKPEADPVQVSFNIPDLFPEGIAYDPFSNYFFVSSAIFGTIGTVNFEGSYAPFITDPVLTGTTGLKVDKARKRLWVSNAEGGVGVYDLRTGERIFYTNLSALLPGAPVFINDLTLDPQGNAYVTNSFSPVIYKISNDGMASVFFQSTSFETAPGDFGFNGIVYDKRGFVLVAHTALSSVTRISTMNTTNFVTVQLSNNLSFPDGMLLSKDGKQLVVMSDDRVLSFISNNMWENGSLSTTYQTGPVFATTLTSDGSRVFALYAHLDVLISGGSHSNFEIQEIPLQVKDQF